jgi:pimeloyl-ACP methyl ester carboxylesterase
MLSEVNTEAPKPDAILFLPGLGDAYLPQGALDIAQRLARAIDFNTSAASKGFTAAGSAPFRYGGELAREAEVAQISIADGDTEHVILDLIRVRYHDPLFRGLEERGPLSQLAFMAWHGTLLGARWLMGLSRSWCLGRSTNGFGLNKRIQLLLGGTLLFMLWLGVVLVMVGGASAPLVLGSAAFGSTQAADASKWLSAMVYPIIAGLAGLFTLSETNVKEAIRKSALQLAAINDYLAADGYKRDEVVADVEGALEAVVESGKYGRIILLGYSLGAVVALDATRLNPRPPPRVKQRIGALVTVGCPFDAIATYWPGYFSRRAPLELEGLAWHNIYSPKDVLGSDFRLLGDECLPHSNVEYPAARSALTDTLSLQGLLAHGRYWTPGDPNHPAVWRPVAQAMYPDDPWAVKPAAGSDPISGTPESSERATQAHRDEPALRSTGS